VTISSVVLIISGLFVYEQITNTIYLTKLEKKVALLKELQSIAGAGIQNNSELYPIYLELVGELSTFNPTNPSDKPPSIAADAPRNDPVRTGKAVSGALLWIILLFFVVGYQLRIDRKFTPVSIALVIFFIVVSGIFAWIGALIPTLYNPWVNYLLFPLFQMGALLWVVRKQG
jgi:hypothetical protein